MKNKFNQWMHGRRGTEGSWSVYCLGLPGKWKVLASIMLLLTMGIGQVWGANTPAGAGQYSTLKANKPGNNNRFVKLGNGVYLHRMTSSSWDDNLGMKLNGNTNGVAIYLSSAMKVSAHVQKKSDKNAVNVEFKAYPITNGSTTFDAFEAGTNNSTEVEVTYGSTASYTLTASFAALTSKSAENKSTSEETFAAGYYYIVGTSDLGTTYVDYITLTSAAAASAAPSITAQPATAAANYEKDATATALSVTATGNGTLTYQWYKNTANNNTSGTAISGATSASYTPSTAEVGTLYYYCVVTNTESGKSGTTVKSNVSGAITVQLNPLGTGHVLTWNLTVRESSSNESTLGTATTDIGTSSKSSTSTYITSLTDLTGNGVKRTTDGKSNNTGKIETPASFDADKYVSMTFTVASGYQFTPDSVQIKTVAVSTAKDLKFVFSDAGGSDTITKTSLSTSGTATRYNLDCTGSNRAYTGTVTVKIYVYGASNAYRLSTPLTIKGTVAEAGAAPSGYTVTYNGSGAGSGTVPTDATVYASGNAVTVKGNTGSLEKDGFGFYGWNTNSNMYGGTHYDAGNTFNITSNTTLYAIWGYSIEYNTDGGTINDATYPLYYVGTGSGSDVTAVLPTDVTKTGYTFSTWKASNGSGAALTQITTGWTGDFTGNYALKAIWTPKVYTVTLHTDEGTINSGDVTSYTYGVGATLPTDVTKANNVFEGWYDNSGLTGDAVTAISTSDHENKEYWAKWTLSASAYSVTHTLSHATKESGENSSNASADYTATYAAASGYSLPDAITVKVGGSTIDEANYTWNSSTGVLTIPMAQITGDVEVVVNAEFNCPAAGSGNVVFKWDAKTGSVDAEYLAAEAEGVDISSYVDNMVGGSAKAYGQVIGEGPNTTWYRNTNNCLYFNGDNAYLKLDLCELAEGDKIVIDQDANMWVSTTASRPDDAASATAVLVPGEAFYVSSTSPLVGATSIYLFRESGFTKVGSLTITRPYDCPTSGTIFSLEMKTGLSNENIAHGTDLPLTSSYATISGGSATLRNNDGSGDDKAKIYNNEAYFNGAAAFIKVEMNCELAVGDTIKSTSAINSNELWLTNTTSTSSKIETVGRKYVVAENDILEGRLVFYVWRKSGGTAVKTLTVTRPAPDAPVPSITTDPVGASYTSGQSIAALTVVAEATGTPDLHYQWYKVGDPSDVEVGDDAALYTPIASGEYYCVVTNSPTGYTAKSATSAHATITMISSDATLAWLKAGDDDITLSAGVYDYEYVLADDATVAPTITAGKNEENATVTITQASEKTGTARIHVVAQDNATEHTYNVKFNEFVGCREAFWFAKAADAPTGKENNTTVFSNMTNDGSGLTQTFTIDGDNYSVTRVTSSVGTFGKLTIPAGYNATVYVGLRTTGQRTVSLEPTSGTTYTCNVAQSDNAVAEFTDVAAGTYSIKVSSNSNFAVVKVNMCKYPVTGVSLPATESVYKDQSITLTPTFTPAEASNKNVTWTTADASIATVENGVVTGKAAGTVNITVTTEDGGYQAICAVTVSEIDCETYVGNLFSFEITATENKTYSNVGTGDDEKVIGDEVATVANGQAYAGYASTSKSGVDVANKQSSVYYYKIANNNTYLKLSLAQCGLKVGDVIDVTSLQALFISTTATYPSNAEDRVQIAANGKYMVKYDDVLLGATELYVWRAQNTNSYLKSISIDRGVSAPFDANRTSLKVNSFGTFCYPQGVAEGMYTGATFYRILEKTGIGFVLEEVRSLQAGRPYMFVAEANTIQVVWNDDAVSAPVNDELNYGLVGANFDADYTPVPSYYDGHNCYILKSNHIYLCGDNCTISKYRAYIDYDAVPEIGQGTPGSAPAGAPALRRIVCGKDQSTAIDNISEDSGEFTVKKVIIDGQMYILRGGNMYDATGRLVK